jgi:hypothetical protein
MTEEAPSNRPLLDKLGVKPGARVAVVNLDDAAFTRLLRERTTDISTGRPDSPCDLVFIGAKTHAELARVREAKGWIEPDGAIWVVRPKGGRSELSDTDVIDAGLAAGLVDNKIASFSDTQAAMRLVYRLRDRPPAVARNGRTRL